jgi:serine/threonine protein kinase
MSEYFIQTDGKVRRMSEQQLRQQLRKNKYSGMELTRRYDEAQWRPLHDTPMFAEEVPFEGRPLDAARWRIARGFLIHVAVYVGCNLIIAAGPVLIIWGIFLVLHGARAVPSLVALYKEGKLPLVGSKAATPVLGAPPIGHGHDRALAPSRAPVTAKHPPVAPASLAPQTRNDALHDATAPTVGVSPPGVGALDPTIGLGAPAPAGSAIEHQQLRESVRGRLFGQDASAPIRVGRYRLDERIGAGGMGLVYRAHDEVLDRAVAVKLLRPGFDAQMGTERLQREARAMARLSHPHVVTVHDVGVFEDSVFVAMEYVDGPTLRQWLREPRAVGDVLDVLVQAGRGMAAAHAAELIHRDFKPENVIVGHDGRVRVLDFGLAKPLAVGETDAGDFVTITGTVLGTPRYMAPEQFRGEPADARTDQFAMGVVFYEAIYGIHPYEPIDDRSLPQSVLANRLRRPPARADVPAAVRDAILRAVAHERAARHDDVEAMLGALGPVPVTRDQFASLAATVRRLLNRHAGDNRDRMLHALDDVEQVVAELDTKAATLASQTQASEVDRLRRELESTRGRLESTDDEEGRTLLHRQIAAFEQRLAGIERATEVLERLRMRRTVALTQLEQLRLDLARADASGAALPDLTDPLQELRYEIDAAQEVDALLRS